MHTYIDTREQTNRKIESMSNSWTVQIHKLYIFYIEFNSRNFTNCIISLIIVYQHRQYWLVLPIYAQSFEM